MNSEKLAQVALEKGISTLVVLEGEAPVQHNDCPVIINGIISAPSAFVEGRKTDFDKSKRHCLISKSKGIITLVLNEQSVTNKYTIVGKIQVSEKFKALGINDDAKQYSPEELASRLKLLRSMFVSNLEHSRICALLRNLKAKINSDIEKLDDRKGNVVNSFKQTVESNMPDAIKLKLPLLEGEEPIEIDVNVILSTNGNSEVKCSLESIDAADLIESQFKERVDQEVEKLKDFVTIIEY